MSFPRASLDESGTGLDVAAHPGYTGIVRIFVLPAAAAALCACAIGSGRVETLSQAPLFRARALAIAPARGTGPLRARLPRALAARLKAGGVHAVDLENSDSVLAGSALGLETASDTRVLDEIRRATEADAVVFLTAAPNWSAIDVQVVSAATGDSVLRAVVRPRGEAFESVDEAASGAAEALALLALERERAKSAAVESSDEIPLP